MRRPAGVGRPIRDGHRPGPGRAVHRRLRGAGLDTAETRLPALGAVRPEPQPLAERWRVLLDPAGHPLCLTAK
ncbi:MULTISPECIES: VOC family protein [unclassified Streptomyces]|uniref:VOC family protein n=1 Tax=unclassified Streptomyces TaxID=2593676 RepID=UPI00131EE1F7|nr:VOC family protein [Streptomyces sp. FR-008]